MILWVDARVMNYDEGNVRVDNPSPHNGGMDGSNYRAAIPRCGNLSTCVEILEFPSFLHRGYS
jgi:hypothetical protein